MLFRKASAFLVKLIRPYLGQEPTSKLIRYTARKEWRLLFLNIGSSVMETITEGATLGLIFLAIRILSSAKEAPFNWSNLRYFPFPTPVATFLNSIPASSLFILLLVTAVLIQLAQSTCRYVNSLSVAYFSARLRVSVTSKVHKQILSFSFPCSSNFKVGDLLDHAMFASEAIRIQLEQTSALFVITLLSFTYLSVLVVISPWLLLAVIIIGLIVYFLQKFMIPRISSGSEQASIVGAKLNSMITEDIQGLRLLHSLGQLDSANQNLNDELLQYENILRKQAPRLSILTPLTSLLPIICISLILAISIFIFHGQTSYLLPKLVTFVVALQRFTIRANMIGTITNTLADNSGRVKRLNFILSDINKQYRRIGGSIFSKLENSIRFDSVSMRYTKDSEYSLDSISFTLPKGRVLALVGASGAGKSSIADLLSGLYTPSKGVIYIDDIPLDSIDLNSWQARLGIVSQDTFLFNKSIAENIAFGAPRSTMQMIEHACKLAQADTFIKMLPDSYDTKVGERGYKLCGGQRQRISLARAFLKNPDIFIFDEATSALDSHNEKLIQISISNINEDQTILVIAHRLSTITNADRILVLDSGRIVQSGTHDELLSINGYYQRLWLMQNP